MVLPEGAGECVTETTSIAEANVHFKQLLILNEISPAATNTVATKETKLSPKRSKLLPAQL